MFLDGNSGRPSLETIEFTILRVLFVALYYWYPEKQIVLDTIWVRLNLP